MFSRISEQTFNLTEKMLDINHKNDAFSRDLKTRKLFFTILLGKSILNVEIKNQIQILTDNNIQDTTTTFYAEIMMLHMRMSVP